MNKLEVNTCSHCGNRVKYTSDNSRLINKVLCTSCNNFSHYVHILTSK